MIVKNTNQIKGYIGINADFNYSVLETHLQWAEESYIPDLLGQTLYDKLIFFVDHDPDSSYQVQDFARIAYFEKLDEKVSRIICNVAVFDWLSVAGVSISDIGLQRLEGEMGGMTRKSAYQYQEKDAKEFFRKKGFNAMDKALQYIMQNIAQFQEFTVSETYQNMYSVLIPTLKIFEKYYNLGGSYLLYIKLAPYIREAELFDIVPAIGKPLCDLIKSNFNELHIQNLLPELRSAICYKAIARGIEATSINILEDGARLIVRDSTNSNMEKTNLPELKNLVAMAEITGDKYIGLLCQNIRADLSKYPQYVDSRISPLDVTDCKMIPLF